MTRAESRREPIDIELDQPLGISRRLFSHSMTTIAFALTALALLPLFAVLFEILRQGIGQLSWEVLVSLPAPAGMEDQPNGFANAIIGTLTMVAIASLISIPFGVMTGIFLAEFEQETPAASFVRFITKILSSVPSIIVGVFAYGVIVIATKKFSAFAGGFALSVIMLPIVALTTEEALKLVPNHHRLASHALGGGRFPTIFRVILPAALPAITTGVLLAVARAAGETAPLLFTALSTQFWPAFVEKLGELFEVPFGADTLRVLGEFPESLITPTPSMSVLIYNYAQSPFQDQNKLAWTAAFILISLVLLTNILSRLVTRKR